MEGRTVKKQSCRMTRQEKETHKAAGKYRRMTDQQLVDTVNALKRQAEKAIAERNAEVALAERERRRAEIAERAAQAAAQNMAKKVKEASEEPPSAKEATGKGAVEKFLQELQIKAGTGNGIGNGTILKLRRILKDMPDCIFEGD